MKRETKTSKANLAKVQDKKDSQRARSSRYFSGVGRRKTAIARVRVTPGSGQVIVNEKEIKDYFQKPNFEETALAPLKLLKILEKVNLNAKLKGGGLHAQAEALRHGLSRALVNMDGDFKKRLRTHGYLTRDPRMVERKKYGLKKARRAPQWKKR